MNLAQFGIPLEVNLQFPEYAWIAIPLVAAVILLTLFSFVKVRADERRIVRQLRFFVIITRSVLVLLLVLALLGPFYAEETISEGDAAVMLLTDNSSSMELFDINTEELKAQLEEHVPVSTISIASGETSLLGDAIFRQLQHQNLLLVTDGNNDKDSMNFIDLATYAEKFNTTINAIDLEEAESDAAISVKGPQSAIVDTDYHFTVYLDNMKKPSRVTVTVDGYAIFDEQTTQPSIDLQYKFPSEGYHKIVATLNADDYFEQNNEWYHVVEIVPKPQILEVGYRPTEFKRTLAQRYTVTESPTLPHDLSRYFAVFVNDVMHELDEGDSKVLEEYTDDGNGLIVWGGMNSFNGPSEIDLLLPVKSGETQEREGEFNFIIVVDMSGIVQLSMTDTELAAAALIDILADRKEKPNIGVVDFSYAGHIIHPLAPSSDAEAMKQAMNDFQDTTTIDGTLWLRPAAMHSGLEMAREMLTGKQGNNNVILVTDGNIHGEKYLPKAVNEIDELTKMGVRVHVYDMQNPSLDDSVLRAMRQYLSSLGGGMFIDSYFSLNALFEKGLIIANYNHFITSELTINAVISGENKVTMAPSGRALITTGTGLPIVAANSYNKVAAIATDDGYSWAEDLALEANEHVVYRIFDWAIGNPNRKKTTYTTVEPATVDKETRVAYKGSSRPTSGRCSFFPVEDHYECTLIPTVAGFDEVMGIPFAVNYAEEYQDVGFDQAGLNMLIDRTNGAMFEQDQINAIVTKAKSDAKVRIIEKHELDWYVLAIAMMVFLFEIFIRRVLQNRR